MDVVYDAVGADPYPPRLRGSSQLARSDRSRIPGQLLHGAGKPASRGGRYPPEFTLCGGGQLHAILHLLLRRSGVQFGEELTDFPTAVLFPLPA